MDELRDVIIPVRNVKSNYPYYLLLVNSNSNYSDNNEIQLFRVNSEWTLKGFTGAMSRTPIKYNSTFT